MKTAPSADIRFECEQCGQHLVVEGAGAGLLMDCPICNTSVVVPATPPHKAASRGKRDRHGRSPTIIPAPSRSPFADPPPDEIREELIDASLINGKLVGDLGQARDEVVRLQQQLKVVAEEHEHLNASTTHTRAELKTFQTERQQLKGELSALRQRLNAADEELGATHAQIEEWKTKTGTATGDAKATDLALKKSRNAVAGLECKLAAVEQALAGENAQRERIAADLAETRQESAEATALVAQLEEELQATRLRLGEFEAALAESQDAGLRLEAERGDLQQRLEEAQPLLAESSALKTSLARTTSDLHLQTEKLRLAEDSNRGLTTCCDQLRHEGDSLRRDLSESHAGREILEVRDQLDAAVEARERNAGRVTTLEAELRALGDEEAAARADVDMARQQRDDAIRKAEAFRESRTVQDNEVLRGIIARLNGELAQRSGEVVRLKRARSGLKAAYILFALGGLAVVAFAIKVLPHALKF